MTAPGDATPAVLAIVGDGRMGRAVVGAWRSGGRTISGPHGRGFDGAGADAVLLCVPDDHIPAAAAVLTAGPFVGHCSGATTLDVLTGVPVDRRFSVHPLITATLDGARFADAPAAVAGGSDVALRTATAIAAALHLRPFRVADSDRAAYHAGAAMAANFLITVEWAAARLLTSADVPTAAVLPLARQALENWATAGPAALTGPVARGDHGTVAAHRLAVTERTPDLLPLFDALVRATEILASRKDTP